jgi:hypothetical protein
VDYVELAGIANTLIADAGRDVTVNRYRQTPADAAKPWRGPSSPTTTPDATTTVKAVFVSPGGAPSLGLKAIDVDLMKRTEEICLIGPGATYDLGTANEVVDGGVHKRVLFVETLKPGDTVLLYVLGVAR